MNRPRYAVGIDLGTTNSALAFVDLEARPRRLVTFEIPQLVALSDVAPRPTLPSFLYLPGEHELPPGATALPWDTADHGGRAAGQAVVGELARTQGAQVPGRLVLSAKSWLCHPAVDRRAPILPWTAPPEVTRRSPVEASAAYLAHLGAAFRHHTGVPLSACELVLTVPASFDEVARELTVEAAERAGLPKLVLLEEPQAAFYSLLADHERHQGSPGASLPLQPGSLVLVCDIGGGTTDFSLIRCTAAEGGSDTAGPLGNLRFERTAVGDHLLLGGDNMDLALARHVERRVAAREKIEKLDAARFLAAVQSCRVAKEKLLGAPAAAAGAPGAEVKEARTRWSIHVAGRGRSLIGGGSSVELERAEAEQAILEGFFPRVARDAEPNRPSGLGLREFGLPYAADAAVTRHLAAFLRRHAATPDAILFNGGVLHAHAIRDRIVEVVSSWSGRAPAVLPNEHPDLAVARGAAWFALARRGETLRIGGGAARAYYVEIDAPGAEGQTRVEHGKITALCLAARGEQEGHGGPVELASATSGREFEVLTNRPVRFKLLSSSDRNDRVGDLVTLPAGALAELPPIVTVLRFARSSQDVSLKVRLLVERTELGTLDIQLHSREGDRFKLAFDLRDRVRSADKPATAATGEGHEPAEPESARVAPERVAAAEEIIRRVFDKAASEPLPAAQAMKELAAALDADKGSWPVAVLRALWEPLKSLRGQRGRTAEHEARWLNLVGYCLRPGYGYPLDDWRVKEAWRLFNAGLVNDKDPRCRLEWWILWRRVSGGLTRTMQDELAKRIVPQLVPPDGGKKRPDRKPPSPQEAAEMYRAAGSLERLPAMEKWRLGEALLKGIERDAARAGSGAQGQAKYGPAEPEVWALGRLGARVPLYGPIDSVISRQRAEKWVERLCALEWATDSSRLGHNSLAFAVAEIARASGDRARDLDEALRQRVVARLEAASGGPHLARLVAEPTQLEAADERFAFGEALPAGLRLSSTEGRPSEEGEPAP